MLCECFVYRSSFYVEMVRLATVAQLEKQMGYARKLLKKYRALLVIQRKKDKAEAALRAAKKAKKNSVNGGQNAMNGGGIAVTKEV